MEILTRAETARLLAGYDRVAIVTHTRPDGDTLGSAAALCRGLRALGKTAHILENPELTPKYAFLVEGLTKPASEEGDILVSVDVSSPGMLPRGFDPEKTPVALRIDHHGSATSFTPRELVEPESAACGEIIWELLKLLGVQPDKLTAEALYTAVSTDTGCFRYANTTAHSFETAAACVAAGADIFPINQAMFETNSLGRLRVQGWLTEHALFLQEGRIAVCALPLEQERRMGLTEEDLDNISGFPRTIEGVLIAAMLRQDAEGTVKLSVRAVPGYDAAAICAVFGGGGHRGAAGAKLRMTMDEAVRAVCAAMPETER